jgi:hypothetical protein
MTRVGIYRWIALLLILEDTPVFSSMQWATLIGKLTHFFYSFFIFVSILFQYFPSKFLTPVLSGQPRMIMSRQTFQPSCFESVLLGSYICPPSRISLRQLTTKHARR